MNGSVYIGGVTLKRLPENDDYLRDIPAVRHLIREKHIAFTKPVTFLVGENGTGKSTLLEAIAVAYGFNAEGGTKISIFPHVILIPSLPPAYFLKKTTIPKTAFFSERKAFTTLPRTLMRTMNGAVWAGV